MLDDARCSMEKLNVLFFFVFFMFVCHICDGRTYRGAYIFVILGSSCVFEHSGKIHDVMRYVLKRPHTGERFKVKIDHSRKQFPSFSDR